MPSKLHLTANRNAVSIAGPKGATANSSETLRITATAIAVDERPERPSVRIRRVRVVLENLILEDDLGEENSLLLSAAAHELNRILLELDHIAGLQQMFELWVQDAP
jgi:hypothetical protein